MAEITKRHLDLIEETHDTVIELKSLVMGNGAPGLCKSVESLKKDVEIVKTNHNNLKTKVFTLIGILVGSGVISGSVIGIDKILK